MRSAHLVFLSCAASLLVAASAQALDWRGSLRFLQAFAAGGGVATSDDPDDDITSSTSFSFDFVGETPRSIITLSPGVSLFLSTSEDLSAAEALRPSFRGSIETRGAQTRLTSSLSLTPRFVPRNQAVEGVFSNRGAEPDPASDPASDDEDTGRRSESSALQTDLNFTVGLNHSLDTRNSLSGDFFARRREFSGGSEEDDLSPSTSFGVNAGWSRELTTLTSGTLSANARQFLPDGGDRDETRTYSLSAGLSSQFSPRLSADGELGLSATETGGTVEPGIVGDFRLDWRATSQTSVFARLSQTVEENSDGEVDTVVAGNFGISTALTERSSLSTSARLSFENPVFDEDASDELATSVATTFSYRLTEDWRLSAVYSLRYETGGDDDGLSSRVNLRLGRSFDLF